MKVAIEETTENQGRDGGLTMILVKSVSMQRERVASRRNV
jgi:hypothetical protein